MIHVAIVVHRHARLVANSYWLRAIAECWHDSGVRLSVVTDPKARIEADIAILHVDLTVTPPDYIACAHRCAVVVNGAVPDISKRAINAHLLRRGDRYEGPVIVKTNRNCAGHPGAVGRALTPERLARLDAAGGPTDIIRGRSPAAP
ncbi:hypothetical protein FRZ44_05480 [Hypericibacter terrae]|jgi:hypothetical protein|uniref:Uncharacterized protein n=1 Tax=Hypericibacter terrae TaxID=2602015 RepID=A0A5J6ME41_9PROT|nr:hypothetical protein [Hypericibacter terrae]QEX15267.1 hypothetical protein FRZ44_05480 [Hypericibacter terrae]